MDLKLVQMLRGAMNAGNGPAGHCKRLGATPNPQPTPKVEQSQQIQPRPKIEPAPRIEPRPVIYPKPRLVERPAAIRPPVEPEMPRIAKSGLKAPWQTLPWENPAPVVHPVKVVKPTPDIVRKGSLIDCFM